MYPDDIVGEVHADGEIIAGAWHDTHLLMGGDWDNTLELLLMHIRLQATAVNVMKVKRTDVLLDAPLPTMMMEI